MEVAIHRATRIFGALAILFVVAYILGTIVLSAKVDENVQSQLYIKTNEYEQKVYEYLKADSQLLDTVAVFMQKSGNLQDEMLNEILLKTVKLNDLTTMFYCDNSGEGYLATSDSDTVQKYSLSTSNPNLAPVIHDALNGKKGVSPIFSGKYSKNTVFVSVTPIYDGENIIGAVGLSDKIDVFDNILNSEDAFREYGNINMINTAGNYVVRSQDNTINQEFPNIFTEPFFSSAEAKTAKAQLQSGRDVEFSFKFHGTKYFAVIRYMGLNDWCLFSMCDVKSEYGGLYFFRSATVTVLNIILFLILLMIHFGYLSIKKNNQELKKLAYYDSLTGAYNLLGFRKALEKECTENADYALLCINIHHFKFINEIFGHQQGDRILCRLCNSIRNTLSQGSFLCRENADIFYVYIKNCDIRCIRSIFTRIKKNMSQLNKQGQEDYEVILYCGVSIHKQGSQEFTLDEMMSHVKSASATARQSRKDDICFFDTVLHKQEIMNNYVETHANQALKNKEFRLFLQPKIDLMSGRIDGAEALVRWIRADGSKIYPHQFIPSFEANGFCVQLDYYMFQTVCNQVRNWIDRGIRPVPVSVNQSKQVIYEKDYVCKLKKILKKYQLPANLFTLEILESTSFKKTGELCHKLEELQEIGFRISLDDFGSEYSSLNTLSKIPLDELKLDRWFLQEAIEKGNTSVVRILKKVIEIAKDFHIATVVEGVETKEAHDLIKSLHCDYGQGYYYSHSVSSDEFAERFLLNEEYLPY